MAKYYTRIQAKRMADLLDLTEAVSRHYYLLRYIVLNQDYHSVSHIELYTNMNSCLYIVGNRRIFIQLSGE